MIIKKIFNRGIFLKILNKINLFYRSLNNVDIEKFDIGKDEILIFSPHADDESIGCAGVMLNYPSNTKVICVTDGRYGDPKIDPTKMIDIRKKEFQSAMSFAHIEKYEFLSIEDGKVHESYDKFLIIDFKKYKNIFIPNYLDRHLDHKAISHHIYMLLKNGYISFNTNIYYYEVWNTVAIVNSYVDISSNIKDKEKIINLYHSQVSNINYTDRIIALNKFRGLSLEVDYAECYMKLSAKQFIEFMDSK